MARASYEIFNLLRKDATAWRILSAAVGAWSVLCAGCVAVDRSVVHFGEAAAFGNGSPTSQAATTSFVPLDATAPLPSNLDALNLYAAKDTLTGSLGTEPFAPQFELYSGDEVKFRHIVMPDGSAPPPPGDTVVWPDGTLFFKTFALTTDSGTLSPLETRVVRMRGPGEAPEYAVYEWTGDTAVLLEREPAERSNIGTHVVPSIAECGGCHGSAAAPSPVLGYTPLQMGLESFVSDLPESVAGYFVGNCVHCHQGTNASAGLDLRPHLAAGQTVNVDALGGWAAYPKRIAPGLPATSALLKMVQGGDDASNLGRMPPFNFAPNDPGFLSNLEAHILSLGGT